VLAALDWLKKTKAKPAEDRRWPAMRKRPDCALRTALDPRIKVALVSGYSIRVSASGRNRSIGMFSDWLRNLATPKLASSSRRAA